MMRETYEIDGVPTVAECLTPEQVVALGGEFRAAELEYLTSDALDAYLASRGQETGFVLLAARPGLVGVRGPAFRAREVA